MTESRRVLTFYRFVPIADVAVARDELQQAGNRLRLKGTILLAEEGVNGTVVGSTCALAQLQALLTERFGDLPYKWSDLDVGNQGFHRFKVRVKPEIVSFGIPELDVRQTGEHVDVQRWHALLDNPEVLVVDTRNQYEVDIGTFTAAVSPATNNFREFPGWVQDNLDPQQHKQVALFCTGGIRCEKASAYMLSKGFDAVYQLDGGILKYLQEVAPEESRWQGECFVFDQRVSVDQHLQQGVYRQCYACRHPLSAAEVASAQYEKGVHCPHCVGALSDTRLANLRQRQRQVELAAARGETHIGQRQGGGKTANTNT